MNATEKAQLANDIIGGDRNTNASNKLKSPTQLDGEWDGTIRFDDADNGVIISHERRVKRANPGKHEPEHEYKTHKRIFKSDDHDGITSHVLDIIKSKRNGR